MRYTGLQTEQWNLKYKRKDNKWGIGLIMALFPVFSLFCTKAKLCQFMSLHSKYERNMKMHPVKGYRQIVNVKIKLYPQRSLHRNVNPTIDTI